MAAVVLLLAQGCTRYLESEGIVGQIETEEPAAAESGQGDGAAQPAEPGAPTAEGPVAATGPQESRYQIFRGTGGVVGRPRKSLVLVTEESDGDITLNFVDADIREVLKATLGGILNVNYTVAPEVKGAVTVQTERPLARAALLPTLENVLLLHGVAIVREGDLYRIAPVQGAARGNRALRLGFASAGEGEGYGVQIVPLYYVGAAQMANTLRPLARKGSILHIDETRNVLVLGGTRYELASLLEAVEIFDVNWLSGMSFGLFRLEFAESSTLVKELRALLGSDKGGALSGLVRLVPVERLNAILAVSRQPRYLDEVRRWVERLDAAGQNGSVRQLFIYFVQNGKAANLAAVLGSVFAKDSRASGAPSVRAGSLAPNLEPVEITSAPASQPESTGDASAGGAATQAQPTYRQQQPPTGAEGISLSTGEQIRIVADEERNALLISSTAREYRAVLSALKRLDRRPLEVLIEVTIADVTLTDRLEYGVRWFFQSGNSSVTQSDLSGGAVTSTFPGLSYVYAVTNARAVLDLLSSITDVKVISAPQLLVLNNQTAQLKVGDQVPVLTSESESSGGAIVSNFALMDTGVILKVTPRVNESGLVLMEIEQEVSSVNIDASAGPLTPTISRRVINTTVAVQSGQTVALGGLIQDNKTNTKVGVPLLSKIPIIGALFRYTTDTLTRSELLVLVTPRIIRDEREAMEATEELRRRMKDLERLEGKIK
jgi:general secretion pathway protein D